jgi:hypothetical protein
VLYGRAARGSPGGTEGGLFGAQEESNMAHRRTVAAATAILTVALAGACTGHHPGRPPRSTTTTTVPVTIPVDGWAITGVTRNQYCGGAIMPGQPTCRPLQPASDQVTVNQGDTTVAQVTSAADGSFRIPVAPGTYTVRASTSAPSQCPAQTVVVSGPPVPTAVELTCQILVP